MEGHTALASSRPMDLHSFIHLLFISIIALFPVVNPIGSAFIVNPSLMRLTDAERKAAVRKITFYAFSICTVTLFAGHWILELFGISIPVIQLAGGIMICKLGWESLSVDEKRPSPETPADHATAHGPDTDINNILFYPITFPITTGAGTISVLFTLSAQGANTDVRTFLFNTAATLLAVVVLCIMVLVFYGNTKRMVDRLGTTGERVLSRITAFLIFCVGLQIAVNGIKSLIESGMLS
ncbi:MAG: MarC family protein [Flavobacteriales bacterium]